MEFSAAQLVQFAVRLSAYVLLGFLIMHSLFTQSLGGAVLAFVTVGFVHAASALSYYYDPLQAPNPQTLDAQCVVLVSEVGIATNSKFPYSVAILAFVTAALAQFWSEQLTENLAALLALGTLLVLDSIHNLAYRCQQGPPATAEVGADPTKATAPQTTTEIVRSMVPYGIAGIAVIVYILSFVMGWGWITALMTVGGLIVGVGAANERTENAARIAMAAFIAALSGRAYALAVPKFAPNLNIVAAEPVHACSAPELASIIRGE